MDTHNTNWCISNCQNRPMCWLRCSVQRASMGSVEKIDSRKGYGTLYEGKKKNRGGRKKGGG